MRATGVVAVLLLCANLHAAARLAYSEHAGHVLTIARDSKSPAGLREKRSIGLPAGVVDLTTLIKRSHHAVLPDDDEAIQNDAPAARLDGGEHWVPPLRPLGLLHGSLDSRLSSHRFCPRPSRGPPIPA